MRGALQRVALARDRQRAEPCEPNQTHALRDVHREMRAHLAEAFELAGLAHIELTRVEERLRIANLLADLNIPGGDRVVDRVVADRHLFT